MRAELAIRDWARCLVSMALFVGSHFIAPDHGGRSRRDVMNRALERLLV